VSGCIHLRGKILRQFDHIHQSECVAVKIHDTLVSFLPFLVPLYTFSSLWQSKCRYKSYLKLCITWSSSAVHSTGSWSQQAAITVHLHCQPQSIASLWPIPYYTAWWQRHVCEQPFQSHYMVVEWLRLYPPLDHRSYAITIIPSVIKS